jgi:predicted nucleic acid-binding protein
MLAVIDTSFWIDYGRGEVSAAERESVERLWRQGGAVLYQFVWLELVVGHRSPNEQKTLRAYRQICRWEPIAVEDATNAERFAGQLRNRGHTMSASDLLILAAADRLGAKLIHHDSDFAGAFKHPAFARLSSS